MSILENQSETAKKIFYIFILFVVFLQSYAEVDFINIKSEQTDCIPQKNVENVFPKYTFNSDTIPDQTLKEKNAVSASVLSDSLSKIDLYAIVLSRLEQKRLEAIGSKYLEFNATTLSGKKISENNFKERITVIDFWMESCSPCLKMFDFFNDLYLHYKNNPAFQLISFTLDSEEAAKKIVEKHNLLFDVICIKREEIYRLNSDFQYYRKL
jgi:Peroxiredoxin